MALTLYADQDPLLKDLQIQFSSLDRELREIQFSYTHLKKEQGDKCSSAFSLALKSLVRVVDYVNKADKALVYWYERGSKLKLALRCVGIDKRTEAIVQAKTKRIERKTADVELRLYNSADIFKQGLHEVQDLNARVTMYCVSSVGDTQLQLDDRIEELNGKRKLVELSLEAKRAEYSSIEEEVIEIPQSIFAMESQREQAQNSSRSTSNAAVGGFLLAGIAGVGAFFFPPAALIALGSATFGVGNAVSSSVYDDRVKDLQDREKALQGRILNLTDLIESLEQGIPKLEQQSASYLNTIASVNKLQQKSFKMREGSQLILNSLLQASMMLSSTAMRIRSIATELSDCGYAQTRREIAGKLRRVVEEFNTGREMMKKIATMERQTKIVMMILRSESAL